MYVGLWIHACATAEQIRSIKTDDKFPVNLPGATKAVDASHKANAFFHVKNRCGAPLYKSNRVGSNSGDLIHRCLQRRA
jgi:hypothetical protein